MVDERTPPAGLPTRTEAGEETVDLPEGLGFFTTGQVLGDRYEILEMLGRGGMGEVWRAFDLKLRVEVGLKALREELFQSEQRLELLRQEVRAAREVVSPNVCRIFDLIEIDGRELVSMEYVDGATLLGVLQERGPLELKEAQDIASQFLSGLEAIHKAGLVHRDVKPENIMLTRAGRVVVMDFGLARGPESGAGSVSGTPAYMAPEHAAGQEVDARADVYSAGVVLAEMVSPEGIKSYETRQTVWEGVRSEPAQVPDSPWASVIQRAVARERERRQNSAHTLIRELEDVTLRVEGAEDLHPYPGLASFTESDAEYFFGREAEVEQLWRKLNGSPRMLGLIGPSGAGKTSFINAGVIPNAGANWSIITCSPGNTAFRSLSRALASELAGDAEAMRELVDLDDLDSTVSAFSRWRGRHDNAVLVVDQFEELFTLNALDSQTRFSELLGRLVIEADVFVLLSLRDDFFFNCHQFEALNPVVTELTLLGPPTGGALRRALVQPATKCGYRFEDDALVEELLTEVEGERGALPLLAFALASLWNKRDRETGLLTRQAYHDIGGVGGALARHAESTVDKIGFERIPIVRELFRNLVTAEGTRAVREWDELLSVFDQPCHPERSGSGFLSFRASRGLTGRGESRNPPKLGATVKEGVRSVPAGDSSTHSRTRSLRMTGSGRPAAPGDGSAQDDRKCAASEVLFELIDSRLLTSYEVREDEHEPIRRVEIIHESLLANWPRLVRWQTQDQEGAQLRDELRQSARSWDEHGRHDDRLWTGTAYREFRLWQEHYPGGLTEVEEAFGSAMTTLATRRKRRRRIIGTAAIVLFALVAFVFAGLWRRGVNETRRAEAETRRAEAAKLLALGQLELDSYPTAALAWATASFELADTPEARLLAVRALSLGPPVTVLLPARNDADFAGLSFNSSGEWLATGDENHTHLWFHDGRTPVPLDGLPESRRWSGLSFGRNDLLITDTDGTHRFWSIPGVEKPVRVEENRGFMKAPRDGGYFSYLRSEKGWTLRWWPIDQGLSRKILSPTGSDPEWDEIDPTGSLIALVNETRVELRSLIDRDQTSRTVGDLSDQPTFTARLSFHPDGDSIAAVHFSDEIRIWPIRPDSTVNPRIQTVDGIMNDVEHSPCGSWIAASGGSKDTPTSLWIFDLEAPVGAKPLQLLRTEGGYANEDQMAMHPSGDWLVASTLYSAGFWPMNHRPPLVYDLGGRVSDVEFTPDGKWLISVTMEGSGAHSRGQLRAWPLAGQNRGRHRVLLEQPTATFYNADLVIHPSGDRVAVGSQDRGGRVYLVPISGDPAREFTFPEGSQRSGIANFRIAFSPDGELMAAAWVGRAEQDLGVVVWDLATGEGRQVGVVAGETASLRFLDRQRLLWTGNNTRTDGGGEVVFDLETGESKLLVEGGKVWSQALSRDASSMVSMELEGTFSEPNSSVSFTNLTTNVTREIPTHGETPWSVALDSEGELIVTGGMTDGVVRVGKVSGEEPHLLLGHQGRVLGVAVSPDRRWIASAGNDLTLRLWPMPDLSRPPLHTLPREELIAKLKTLTNLRVVRDPESSTGWTLTHDPFPGWETVPTW